MAFDPAVYVQLRFRASHYVPVCFSVEARPVSAAALLTRWNPDRRLLFQIC